MRGKEPTPFFRALALSLALFPPDAHSKLQRLKTAKTAKMLDKKVIEHYDKYQVEIPPCNWQVYPAFFF
ncbi:MAG: hypothetical protein DRJ14_00355 [Acidobacteria bacterium]|nr:MAG: hypothetical protein DRJ14_00355 [Acidobacteriota bacterium]